MILVQITHKDSGENVKFTNSVRIYLTLQILRGIPSILNSAQNSVRAESENSTVFHSP